jgi:hypothetical protein
MIQRTILIFALAVAALICANVRLCTKPCLEASVHFGCDVGFHDQQ